MPNSAPKLQFDGVKNKTFAQDFLEKQQVGDVKTKLSCETSLKQIETLQVEGLRSDCSSR